MRALRLVLRVFALVVLLLFSAIGPFIAPYSPTDAQPLKQNSPPDSEHLLGRDGLGRDTWSRLLWGAQGTLGSAALATLIATLGGVALGSVAGAFGGIVDQVVVHTLDMLLAIPGLLLALLILSLMGDGLLQVSLSIGLSLMPAASRLVRATVLDVRSRGYVESAYALGGDTWWVVRHHILRNSIAAITSYASIILAWSILNVAAFDFLGLSGDLSIPGWGRMLNDARSYIHVSPMAFLAPGFAIVISVLSITELSFEWQKHWWKLGQ